MMAHQRPLVNDCRIVSSDLTSWQPGWQQFQRILKKQDLVDPQTGIQRADGSAEEDQVMEMLLMALCMSAFALLVAALAFRAATGPAESTESLKPALPAKPAVPARFFAGRIPPIVPPRPQVPIEVLLREIEDHVRPEPAAAGRFRVLSSTR